MTEQRKDPASASLTGSDPSTMEGLDGQVDTSTQHALQSSPLAESRGRQRTRLGSGLQLPLCESPLAVPLTWSKGDSICIRQFIDDVPFELPCLVGCNYLPQSVCMRDFKTIAQETFPELTPCEKETPGL